MIYPIGVSLIGGCPLKANLFQPSIEGEARILLLITTFSKGNHFLEGRTKLAKLDFFLRYHNYFDRAIQLRGGNVDQGNFEVLTEDIESTMIRYRYGPWDPSYFSILGRLIGKGLIKAVEYERGVGYKTTDTGVKVTKEFEKEPAWNEIIRKLSFLRKYLNLSGTTLKNFIYDNFPEICKAEWGESL